MSPAHEWVFVMHHPIVKIEEQERAREDRGQESQEGAKYVRNLVITNPLL